MTLLRPLNTPIRDWAGRRVWVIGASSGIGEALARALGARGARVAVSARSAARLAQVVADCGAQAVAEPLDITRAQELEAARDRLLERWGGFDLVVLCAGAYRPQRAWELSSATIRETVGTNVIGTMEAAAAVAPALVAAGAGAIAVVGSVAGYGGLPKAAVYGPSKAALINFAEALYLDLAPRGVSVFLVSPGFVATPLTAGNDFRMPALLVPVQAAQAIIDGLARGDFEIHFPKRFTRVMRALRWLPRRLYFPLVRRATGL